MKSRMSIGAIRRKDGPGKEAHAPRIKASGTSAWMVGLALVAVAGSAAVLAAPSGDPAILTDPDVIKREYLPDFSFAGYQFGEQAPGFRENAIKATVFDVTAFGARADDALDDSVAIAKALEAAHAQAGPVVVSFPAGRFILSDIIYIERSDFVIRGAGSGATQLHFPRPLMYLPDPPALKELREYLSTMNKRQREKHNNLDLPYSQYAWSGGFIWTRVPGERVKAYLDEYHQPQTALAQAVSGKRGHNRIEVRDASQLSVGDVVSINWYNKAGEKGPLVQALYQGADVKVGSHHWTLPEQPLVAQKVLITAVNDNTVTIKDTLLLDIERTAGAELAAWPHLSNVGIEHLSLDFPDAPRIAHHVEQGFNGIFLTRLFNGWVRDVAIHNADSGVLTEEIANVTISDITTTGSHIAHYAVAMGDTHNVLVKNLQVFNTVVHPLSFNTFSTRSVYSHCEVFTAPVLDQHSGANHQNLFDDIRVHVDLSDEQNRQRRFPLFKGGGASYWKPTHGAFSTFWNIAVQLNKGFDGEPLTLYGVNDGPEARLIGIHGNAPLHVEYGPDAYIEGVNNFYRRVPSLYEYQLHSRLESR